MAQPPSTALQQLELLQKRVESLSTRRTRVQLQLETARQQHAEAVAEANSLHGTSDLGELRAILVRQEADNAQAVADFTRAVDEFEQFITRIEEALANPEVMAALVAAMEPASASVAPAPAPAATATAVPVFSSEEI